MLADKPGPHLPTVNPELHSVETFLHDAAGMVRNAPAGVGNHLCCSVLHHHHTVPVIGIRNRICACRETVEEKLLAAEILRKGLVIVQMVVGEIGEDADVEIQTRHALLLHTDRADLHEAVFTALVHHLPHQGIDGDRVRRSVGCLQHPVAHIIGNGGEQSAPVAEIREEVVEQCHRCGLAIGSCDADKGQAAGRMAVEGIRRHGHGISRIGDTDKRHLLPDCTVQAFELPAESLLILVQYGRGTFFNGGCNEFMSIARKSAYRNEGGTRCHLPGIAADRGYVNPGRAGDRGRIAL